jgi:predicted small lipoprotein YifL
MDRYASPLFIHWNPGTPHMKALILALLAAAFLAACEREGPLERAGEKVDRAVERAGDKIEDATDRK